MADNTNLDILIRAVLDAKGFDDLQKRLQDTTAKAGEAKAGATEFSSALTDMGGKLLAAAGLTVGLAEAVSFLKEGFASMIQETRLVNQFTAANEVLGKQIGDNTEANEKWLFSLEVASGRTKDEIIPSYVRLVAITQDVAEAQRLANIAALASKAGFGDVATVTQALIRYYETGATQTRGFGAVLKALAGDAATTSDGLQKVEKAVVSLAEKNKNAATEVDQARVRWEETREAIFRMGEGLVEYLLPALKLLSEGIVKANEVGQKFRAELEGLAFTATETFRAVKLAATGNLTGAKEVIEGIGEGIDLILQNGVWRAEKFSKEITAIWDTTAGKLNQPGGPFHPPPQAGGELDALRKKYQTLADGAVHWGMEEKEARLAVLKVYQQMANDPAVAKFPDLQAEANRRLVAAVNALGKEVAKEAEEEVAADKKRAASFEAETEGEMADEGKRLLAARKARDERVRLALMEAKALSSMSQDELQEHKRALEERLRLEKLTAEQIIAIHQRVDAIDRQVANNSISYLRRSAAASSEILGAVFAHNKDAAIAQSVINAAAGIVAIYGDPANEGTPWYVKLVEAAALAALAAEQIATITNTDIGSTSSGASAGFDDPQNDFAVVAGGRKWAKDMIGLYGGGAHMGFREAMGDYAGGGSTSVVNNRAGDRSITIHLNAGIGTDRTQLMRFVKNDLVPVLNRYDQRRTLQ